MSKNYSTYYTRHYAYDAIGNLIQDAAEDINNIQWTVYGKVKKVDRGSPKHDITFNYGPDGQRISKTVFYDYTGVANDSTVTTYYVRDASGNIMATYRYTAYGFGGDEFYLGEQHIYGSSRIGYREANLDLQSAPVGGPSTAGVIYVERGRKRYEMSNHLGNVLSVISDRRKLICNPPTGVGMDPTPGYYQADIIMATDYSSFGAPMVARNWNSSEYKFGFNGQLKDDEVYGAGNAYDFGARIYDPRLGRWLAVDPSGGKYPSQSPYNFVANKPLIAIDPNGKEIYFVIYVGGTSDGAAAAQTRVNEIEKGFGFDPITDKVYYLEVPDLGLLEGKIKECVADANANGYGKTVELNFFGHGAADGPIGAVATSQNSLSDVTGNYEDKNQLSPTGWKNIDFNFDEEGALAAFYGCKTSGFAEKFLAYQPKATYTAGIAGGAGGSRTYVDKFISNENIWYIGYGKTYFVDQSGGQVEPRDVYSRDPATKMGTNLSDAEGNIYPARKTDVQIYGNVTLGVGTKTPIGDSGTE